MAETYDATLALIRRDSGFHLVILDLRLPGMDAFQGLKALHGRLPDTPLIVTTEGGAESEPLRAIHSGALACVPNSASDQVLLEAIELALAGEPYLPPPGPGRADPPPRKASAFTWPVSGGRRLPPLTPRQSQVLGLISQGFSNNQIARELGLAEGTVRTHVSAILKTLDLRNRTQAALAAMAMEAFGTHRIQASDRLEAAAAADPVALAAPAVDDAGRGSD